MAIEERIQELRKNKGFSQEQLADVLGVSRQAVSKWEGGQSLPELEKLVAMSELFETSTDYILKGTNPPRKKETDGFALAAQILPALATMLFGIAIFAALGENQDGDRDLFGGLVIESVAIMTVILGVIFAKGHILFKPLFAANALLAGVLPSMLAAQTYIRYKPTPAASFDADVVLLFSGTYLLICGLAIYFGIVRSKKKRK